MDVLDLVLLLIAALCFLAAAFFHARLDSNGRGVNLVALGLLAWVSVPLFDAIRALD